MNEAARSQLMVQQERFAVGMIGFAIEHDDKFRAHFLERICDLADLSRTDGWEVLVEPENWGDLVLKHPVSRSLQSIRPLSASFRQPADERTDFDHQNLRCLLIVS